MALPDCGKPVRSFLPQVSSPPLRRLVGPHLRGKQAEGNLFQINRSGQQSHRSNYLPRLFVLCTLAATACGCPGATTRMAVASNRSFQRIDSWLCVIIGFVAAATFKANQQIWKSELVTFPLFQSPPVSPLNNPSH